MIGMSLHQDRKIRKSSLLMKLNLIITDQQIEQLGRNVNPHEESNSEGIALYLQTIDFLNQCLEC